jgi:hypothetical protein
MQKSKTANCILTGLTANMYIKTTIEHLSFEFNQTLNELLKIDEALAVDKTQETLFDLVDFESDELDAIEKALSGA